MTTKFCITILVDSQMKIHLKTNGSVSKISK